MDGGGAPGDARGGRGLARDRADGATRRRRPGGRRVDADGAGTGVLVFRRGDNTITFGGLELAAGEAAPAAAEAVRAGAYDAVTDWLDANRGAILAAIAAAARAAGEG